MGCSWWVGRGVQRADSLTSLNALALWSTNHRQLGFGRVIFAFNDFTLIVAQSKIWSIFHWSWWNYYILSQFMQTRKNHQIREAWIDVSSRNGFIGEFGRIPGVATSPHTASIFKNFVPENFISTNSGVPIRIFQIIGAMTPLPLKEIEYLSNFLSKAAIYYRILLKRLVLVDVYLSVRQMSGKSSRLLVEVSSAKEFFDIRIFD